MFDFFVAPFADFLFMQRALVGCLIVCLSATPIGVFMMIRRMSLTGDAMAHAVLPGAAIGFLLAGLSVLAMAIGGLIAGCVVALLTGLTSRKTNTNEDANLAAYYLIALALGVLIISWKGSGVDLIHVLFGSTLALHDDALWVLAGVCGITLTTLAIMYRPMVMEALDSSMLCTHQKWSTAAHMSLLFLIVLNLVGGFQAMGTLMAVGLMILPAVVARFWVSGLEGLILLATFLALFACYLGLLLSFYWSFATSSMIILVLGVFYALSMLFGIEKGWLVPMLRRRMGHLSH